jgi:hypothetical protein
MNTLAIKNAHPRDALISFDEPTHIYTITRDDRKYTSVTTLNKGLFRQFDGPVVAAKLAQNMNRINNPNDKYYQMSARDIEKMWAENGADASSRGTGMHLDIEKYFNEIPVTNKSKEFRFFLDFWREYGTSEFQFDPETPGVTTATQEDHDNIIPGGLVPYRTEWCVFYEEYQLSGSIDMIFENPDGTLQIYDWKRCKEISPEHENKNYPKFGIIKGLERLPDTHYWHYALQLNMYKRILETKYNKVVTDLYLVCLHPDHDGYQRIELPVLSKTIDAVLKYRKTQLRGSIKKSPKITKPDTKEITNTKITNTFDTLISGQCCL